MGLQDYKQKVEKEKSKPSKIETNDFPLHTVRGSSIEQEELPQPFRKHTVVVLENANTVRLPDADYHFICSDCGQVGSSYMAILKCDKLKSKGHDDIEEVIELAKADYHNVQKDEYLYDPDAEIQIEDDEEDEDDDNIDESVLNKNKSGLDAYKS